MDVEAIIAKALKSALDVPAYLEVPENAPDSFVTVEQTSMETMSDHLGKPIMANVSLDVDCWCLKNQRKQAAALADSVIKALSSLETEPITTTKHENTYRENDPDTGRSRYVVQIETAIQLKED